MFIKFEDDEGVVHRVNLFHIEEYLTYSGLTTVRGKEAFAAIIFASRDEEVESILPITDYNVACEIAKKIDAIGDLSL